MGQWQGMLPVDDKDKFPISDEMKALEVSPSNVIDLTQRKLLGPGQTLEGEAQAETETPSRYLKGRKNKGEDGKAIVTAWKVKHGASRAGPKLPDGLTHKQDKFCKLVAYGDSLGAAYAEAFQPPNSSRQTIDNSASRMFARPEIKARIDLFKQRLSDREQRLATRSIERWFDSVWQLADEAETDASKVSALKLIGQALGIGKVSDEKKADEKPEDIEKELKEKLSAALAKLTR